MSVEAEGVGNGGAFENLRISVCIGNSNTSNLLAILAIFIVQWAWTALE